MRSKEEDYLMEKIEQIVKDNDLKFKDRKSFIDTIIPFLKQNSMEYSRIKDTFMKIKIMKVLPVMIHTEKISFGSEIGKEENPKTNESKTSNRISDFMTRKRKVQEESEESKVPKTLSTVDHLSHALNQFDVINPIISFKNIGISDETLEMINKIMLSTRFPKFFSHIGVKRSVGAIVCGFPGSGKTHIIHAIAGEFNLPLIVLHLDYIWSSFERSQPFPRGLTSKIKSYTSGIVLLDGIDLFLSSSSETHSHLNLGNEKKFVNYICDLLDDISSDDNCSLMIFATTTNLKAVDISLIRPGRLEYVINIPIPNEILREKILQVNTESIMMSEVDLSRLARLTPGFVAADICALIREASLLAIQRFIPAEVSDFSCNIDPNEDLLILESMKSACVVQQDFLNALSCVQPSSVREGFCSVPADVTWNDVGALAEIREALELYLLGPIENPERFKELGLKSSSGILLVGPPGCGKTMIAKAVANQACLNFISIRGPEILNQYVGESERAIRNIFTRAQNSEPCVIFFDEIDSLCPCRTKYSDSQFSSRLVNQLLTEMDGILSRKRVFILAATNRPEIIDSAILRKGRFDKIFYVGLPNPDERLLILNTITKNGTCPILEQEVNLEDVAFDNRCERYSGADLYGLVKEASLLAFQRVIRNKFYYKDHPVVVTKLDFEEALDKTKPSVSVEDLIYYENMRKIYHR